MYNRQLDAFIKAAERKSFSKAAQDLFIAPTSLIQQINTLENSIGITLFLRTPRGVSLTPAGESLYKDACQIISLSQEAVKRARQLQDGPNREIRVGQSPYRGTSHLLQMIVEFQKETQVSLLSSARLEARQKNGRSCWPGLEKTSIL